MALTVPIAVTLDRRASAELERENLVRAEAIAQDVGRENLVPSRRRALNTIVHQAGAQIGGRVIVVDAAGRLLADSEGIASGQPYATPGRPEIVAALQDLPTSDIRFSQDLGRDIMATAVPIVDESELGVPSVLGVVRITQTMDQVAANVRRITWGVIAIGLAGLTTGLILAFALSGSLSRPLRRLADVTRRLGAGDLTARAGKVRGPEEVEELASSFDEMAAKLERTVLAQRQFVANASHQLRTPLTGMKLRLESAKAEADSEEMRVQLSAADGEVDRLSAIVDRLLATAKRIEAGEPREVDLHDVAERAVERWWARSRDVGAELVLEGCPARTRAEEAELDQILDNLLDNATQYAPGRIEVGTGSSDGRAWVSVRDHGAGIALEDLPHATERFYRGRGAPAGGSGLGLAVVQDLAERFGGSLSIERAEDGGTVIEVDMPAPPP